MNRPALARDIMATKLVVFVRQLDVFEAINVLRKHRIFQAPVSVNATQ